MDLKCVLGYVDALVGEKEEAIRILSEVKSKESSEYVSPFCIAMLYSGLEDSENCLNYIEKSLENRSCELESLFNDSMFEEIRSDPRLEPMLNKVGLTLTQRGTLSRFEQRQPRIIAS
jgi:hypothetical protein